MREETAQRGGLNPAVAPYASEHLVDRGELARAWSGRSKAPAIITSKCLFGAEMGPGGKQSRAYVNTWRSVQKLWPLIPTRNTKGENDGFNLDPATPSPV